MTNDVEVLKGKTPFTGEPGTVTVRPEWRPVVSAFVAARDAGEFKPGDLVPHSWWRAKLGLPTLEEEDAMPQAKARVYRFAYMGAMESIKDALADEEQIWVRDPVTGKGFRWVPTEEQPGVVLDDFKANVRKAARRLGQGLGSGLDYAALTPGQQAQATDGLALRGAVVGLFRKQLKRKT